MFSIDARTGTVTWGDYELSIRLTYEEFRQKYPHLTPISDLPLPARSLWAGFRSPPMKIDDNLWRLRVDFSDGVHVSSIVVDREASGNSDSDKEWWQQEIAWRASARDFLRSQFGQPHKIYQIPHDHSDVIELKAWLTVEQLRLLDVPEYTFEWGKVELYYNTEDWDNEIWIRYTSLA